LLERAPHQRVVRDRDNRVEEDAEQAADLAAIDLAEQLDAVDAGWRQVVRLDAPDARDVRAVLRVVDAPHARELVRLLAVLAAALPVALPRDRAVAAALAPDPARRQHDVDRAQHVLHAVAVVLYPARVDEKARPCLAPQLGRGADPVL